MSVKAVSKREVMISEAFPYLGNSPAGGRGQPSPGGGEVGRRSSRTPADQGEQGPQQEGGRSAAQPPQERNQTNVEQ